VGRTAAEQPLARYPVWNRANAVRAASVDQQANLFVENLMDGPKRRVSGEIRHGARHLDS
jgi:hypothetical protein